MNDKNRCQVGGVDRTGNVDKISIIMSGMR